jgi:hypothetical protein
MPSGRRLGTALSRLQLSWRDQVATDEFILGVEEIIETLRQDDPRPLLILRDCEGCQNKEGDLLKRTLDDERFLLATPWFHCVKVDSSALEKDHPYHKLFKGSKPAHVVVATWDGRKVLNVNRAGQKEIWKSMQVVLRGSYKKNAATAMKGLSKLLEQYDALDNRESELNEQLAAKEAAGKTRRADKLREELEELDEERKEAIEEEAKLRDLELKFVAERDGEKQDKEKAGV